ncbi:hypothetical protein CDCA_CDCA04G1337 [Cyanidium caldarium]|uniref:Uncharacterized protein n=1 Tax=Cyanidium caldarium TaxID=2771 RepID=A0AAV9ISS8_CYACA|nr:hypothetical protein CDCA_CDCA04G1337 [Cyanidium caldarium]
MYSPILPGRGEHAPRQDAQRLFSPEAAQVPRDRPTPSPLQPRSSRRSSALSATLLALETMRLSLFSPDANEPFDDAGQPADPRIPAEDRWASPQISATAATAAAVSPASVTESRVAPPHAEAPASASASSDGAEQGEEAFDVLRAALRNERQHFRDEIVLLQGKIRSLEAQYEENKRLQERLAHAEATAQYYETCTERLRRHLERVSGSAAEWGDARLPAAASPWVSPPPPASSVASFRRPPPHTGDTGGGVGGDADDEVPHAARSLQRDVEAAAVADGTRPADRGEMSPVVLVHSTPPRVASAPQTPAVTATETRRSPAAGVRSARRSHRYLTHIRELERMLLETQAENHRWRRQVESLQAVPMASPHSATEASGEADTRAALALAERRLQDALQQVANLQATVDQQFDMIAVLDEERHALLERVESFERRSSQVKDAARSDDHAERWTAPETPASAPELLAQVQHWRALAEKLQRDAQDTDADLQVARQRVRELRAENDRLRQRLLRVFEWRADSSDQVEQQQTNS